MKATARKPGRVVTTDAEMRDTAKAARRRERTATKICAAHFDETADAIVAELSTGASISVPRSAIPGFAQAEPKQLSDVAVTPGNEGLWSDTVDDGVLLEQLLVLAAGEATLGTLGARINAAKKTPARAAASRANGSKGGRPRKDAA